MMRNIDSSHLARVQKFIESPDNIRKYTNQEITIEDLNGNYTDIDYQTLLENDFNVYKAYLDTKRSNRFLTAQKIKSKDYYKIRTLFFSNFRL